MDTQAQDKEKTMQRYEIATPRLAVATAAMALTAITLSVMVVIPATMDADARAPIVASAEAAPPGSAALATSKDVGAEQEVSPQPCAVADAADRGAAH
jgi:hypothetical protein